MIIGRDQEEVDRVERERVINPLITINSPIDGTVIARKVGPGQYVRSDVGDALYSIADLSTMWLKANVPEVDIPLVRVGPGASRSGSTRCPIACSTAHVIAIGAASDASTRRVVVRSEIPNPDRALKSEMFATFKIAIGDGEPAPSVPVEAVIWEGETPSSGSSASRCCSSAARSKVGLEQDGRLQVVNGLEAGDRVVEPRRDLRARTSGSNESADQRRCRA